MNDKTKEAISKVLDEHYDEYADRQFSHRNDQALDAIISIVEAERKGEVVIRKGEMDYIDLVHDTYMWHSLDGKKGRLVFIPQEDK